VDNGVEYDLVLVMPKKDPSAYVPVVNVTPQVRVGGFLKSLQAEPGYMDLLNVLHGQRIENGEYVAYLQSDRGHVVTLPTFELAEQLLMALGAAPEHATYQVRYAQGTHDPAEDEVFAEVLPEP